MLKMVDGTGIIGVDMVCPLGGTVSPPQPPNYDKVEVEGVGSLMLPNSLKAPLERLELLGNSVQNQYVLVKEAGTTSIFNFGVKWNEVNKIVLVADSIAKSQHIFFATFDRELIGIYPDMSVKFAGLTNGQCNLTSEQIIDGNKHEIIFTFDRPISDREITNIWDASWSKKIRYYRIGFYSDDVLIANFIPESENKMFDTVSKTYISASIKDGVYKLEQADGDPAPDNPQEIKNAGRKSKNLLNLQKQPDVKETYLGWKVSDGRNVVLSVKDKGNNADITGCYLGLSRTGGSSDGVVWAVNNGSVATKEVVSKNQYVSVFPPNETTVRKLLERFDIQVEYGGNATDYEPYGYLLDVKVTGKNLLDKSIILPLSSYDIKDGIYWRKYFYLLPNTDYLIRVTPHYTEKLVDTSGFLGVGEPYDNNLPNGIISLIPDVGTTDKTNYFRTDAPGKVILKFKDSANEENIRKMLEQVEITLALKTFNNEHEPYTEQILTLTSDRPITKWDKLVEQGGEIGWLYQSVINSNVKPSRGDLFPNGFSLFKDFGNGVYVYKVTNIKKAIGFQTSLCEQFKNKDGSYSTGDLFCYSDQPSMQMQYFVTDIPTLEEFKTWMETNPLTMVYQTVESQFIPLSESEQTQLRNLHSYNGTTNITVDSGEVPCGIKLTYRKEI